MLKRVGIENRTELVVFIALALLVAIAPLGKEATNPIVLGIYRTLLLVISIAALVGAKRDSSSDVCPYFLLSVGGLVLWMSVSILLSSGSHFPGIYVLYEHALFLAAFIALSRFQRQLSIQWKRAVLLAVVLINLGFLTTALAVGQHPLMATFVNPNYFASYLLAGLAVSFAYGIFGSGLAQRALAFAAATFLYYGITQASSRGATLAALAMLGLAVFRIGRQKGYPMLAIVLVCAVVGGVTLAATPNLARKFFDRGSSDPYNYQRPQIWLSTLKMIGDHPILGVGPSQYYYVAKLYTPAVEGTVARYRRWPNIAHSEYLQFAAEIGIPGALFLFSIGAFLFWTAWKRARSLSAEPKVFQEAGLLLATGLGAHALVDNNWTVPVMAAGFAVISQADLLPYRAWSFRMEWTPARRVLAGTAFVAVFAQSTLIPVVGLYFNESGHRAYTAGQFQRAELMHSMAVGILPDHPVLLDNLGMVYFDEFMKTRKKEYLDQAELKFQASMTSNPHFDVPGGHLETALIQRLTGDIQKDRPIHMKIVAADRHVLASNPFNPFIRRNLAEALYNLGSKDEAMEELRRTVSLEPNYVPGYLRLAQWSAETGRAAESEEYERKAIELVTRYQGTAATDHFEALILGRPEPPSKPQ